MSDFSLPSSDKHEVEEGAFFSPRFDANGLITAVVCDARDNSVLMVAHMNDEALRLSLTTGIAHYWSRSRQSLWKKGETSGNMQQIVEMRTDCDQDAIVMKVNVRGDGVTCHTHRHSCFYRTITHYNGDWILQKASE
jgi:phosphoribosyl-AMP cyclohydrolase